jgi:hypothetical protein
VALHCEPTELIKMLPPLSEVTTRPDETYHGKTQTMTLVRPFNVNNHVQPFDIRPEVGGPCELEKRKCSGTFVPSPTRSSTPELLKNKRQQPRHNPYTEPNITIVTQNIRGTQGSKYPQGNIIDLGDIESVNDPMRSRNIDIYLLQETWIYKDIETEI